MAEDEKPELTQEEDSAESPASDEQLDNKTGGTDVEAEQPGEEEEILKAPDNEAAEADRPTRQERHSQRQADRLSDRVRNSAENATQYRNEILKQNPYQPLNYDNELQFSDPNVAKTLYEDRNQYGDTRHSQGIQMGYNMAQLERFADKLEDDGEFVQEKYSDYFEDPDFVSRLNSRYMQETGVSADRNGNILSVANPSVRYKNFVADYIGEIERFAQSRTADTAKNVAKQSSRQSVRSTSASRKALGDLRPGDISKMSDEEYERHKHEINRRLTDALN